MFCICIACHKVAEIKPLPKRARLKCSACGSRVARVVRKVLPKMLNGGQTDPEAARTMTFAGLLSIASARGYKPAWAAMKYKIIYGEWPHGEPSAGQNPSGELLWWIKKQNIEYAKARRAAEGVEWSRSRLKPETQSQLMTGEDWNVDLSPTRAGGI